MKKTLLSLFFFILLSSFCKNCETTVLSDEVLYNGEMITLSGHVLIENIMGKLTADHAILKKDESRLTKIEFPWIELTSNVVLMLPNGEILKCELVSIDYTKMSSSFGGEVPVYFSGKDYEIFSEKAHIDYKEEDGSLKPTKILLKNNVRIVHKMHSGDAVPEMQYALADLVTYFPEEETMIMEGEENKVLFYDKTKDMQLSAKTIKAIRNKETKKETIQGIGDVRFIFGPEELERITKRFHFKQQT